MSENGFYSSSARHPSKRKRESSGSGSSSAGGDGGDLPLRKHLPLKSYARKSEQQVCYRPKFPAENEDDDGDSRSSSPSALNGAAIMDSMGIVSAPASATELGTGFKTYGKRATSYKPKFPSDDSPFSSNAETSLPGGVRTYGRREGSTYRPRFPSDDSDPPAKEDTDPFQPSTSPSRRESDEVKSNFQETSEPLKYRPERSAACKASDLIKSLAPIPKKKKSDTESVNSELTEEDESSIIDVPRFKLDPELVRSLPSNLQTGYRLYLNLRNDATLRSDIFPFLLPVETTTPETANYYEVIEKPMWLTKIESRLTNLGYFSTSEIIADLRLVLENCYRFNGVDSWISRMACKVEMAMEGRIKMLPFSIREQCSLSETTPHLTMYRDVCGRRARVPRVFTHGSRSPIMIALEETELYRDKEVEVMRQDQLRRREVALAERTIELAKTLSANPTFQRVCESWELISSCLMVCVCQENFNIAFTVSDLELGLLYPKHSEYLGNLVTAICASEKKLKEVKKRSGGAALPYEEWNELLRTRMGFWYTTTAQRGIRITQNKWGVTNEFYEIFGTQKPTDPSADGVPTNHTDATGSNETSDTVASLKLVNGNKGTPSDSVTDSGTDPLPTKDDDEKSARRSIVNGAMFHHLSIGERLTLLHCLCTAKVVGSPKLQHCFLEYEASSLRPTILGRDTADNAFFYFPLWPEEVRVYAELAESGDIRCVARSLDELEELLTELRSGKTATALRRVGEVKEEEPTTRIQEDLGNPEELVRELEALLAEFTPHRDHFKLVHDTVYKRLANSLMDARIADVTPARAPPTPTPHHLPLEPSPPSPPRPATKKGGRAAKKGGRKGGDQSSESSEDSESSDGDQYVPAWEEEEEELVEGRKVKANSSVIYGASASENPSDAAVEEKPKIVLKISLKDFKTSDE